MSRHARTPGTTARPWKKAATIRREQQEQLGNARRGQEYSRETNAAPDMRAYWLIRLRSLERGWFHSGNLEYLFDALEVCAQADACPAWVAEWALDMMRRALVGGDLQKWWKRHVRDMIDAERHSRLKDARKRGGLKEGEGMYDRPAAEFVAEQLLGSIFYAGAEAIRASYKRVERAERKGDGWRYYVGRVGELWNGAHTPRRTFDAFVKWEPRFRREVFGDKD